jgi:hypothetical protein
MYDSYSQIIFDSAVSKTTVNSVSAFWIGVDASPIVLTKKKYLEYANEGRGRLDRLLGRGISLSQGLYLHAEQHKHTINAHSTDIHALSWIQTQDPRVRTNEDSSCLRPSGHCDRRKAIYIDSEF